MKENVGFECFIDLICCCFKDLNDVELYVSWFFFSSKFSYFEEFFFPFLSTPTFNRW